MYEPNTAFKFPANPMEETEAWLKEAGVEFSRPSPYQIKIGPVNYYPSKGTIFQDRSETKHGGRGLSQLEFVLRKLGLMV